MDLGLQELDPICYVLTVKAGDGVMVMGMFYWYTFGLLIPIMSRWINLDYSSKIMHVDSMAQRTIDGEVLFSINRVFLK